MTSSAGSSSTRLPNSRSPSQARRTPSTCFTATGREETHISYQIVSPHTGIGTQAQGSACDGSSGSSAA